MIILKKNEEITLLVSYWFYWLAEGQCPCTKHCPHWVFRQCLVPGSRVLGLPWMIDQLASALSCPRNIKNRTVLPY